MQAVFDELILRLSTHLQTVLRLKQVNQVTGGDISQAYCLDTDQGRFFVKLNRDCPGDFFNREAEGLQLLAAAGQELTVPVPVLYGQTTQVKFLVLNWLEKERYHPPFWQTFALGLTALHRHTATQFGLATGNYIGRLPQPNQHHDNWAAFYATQRILPLAQQAFDAGLFDEADVQAAEQVCARLHHYFPAEPPALLHGDLWGGNYLCTTGNRAAIFDPAVYYGHREMDIAMSLLFGGFDQAFYHFYQEAYPLEKNWRERIALCQLYPLMVHLLLFGGGYYGDVKTILYKYR